MSEEIVFGNPQCKPCMMTVFMHDYATYSPSQPLLDILFSGERKPRTISLKIFQNITMEGVREMSNEQIGESIRKILNNLDEQKKKFENGEFVQDFTN